VRAKIALQLSKTLIQMARFGAVGLLNTLVGLSIIYACMFVFGAGLELANMVGYGIGLCLSFQLNKRWTFSSARPMGEAAPRFGAVIAIAWLVNLAVVSLSARSGMNPYLAQLCGVAPYTILCFLGCRFFVFPSSFKALSSIDRA
jgi:putative flippase GtrA